MSMIKKLIAVPRGLNAGIRPDLHPMSLEGVWVDGSNVRMTATGVRKMDGWTKPFTSLGSIPVRGMGQLLDGNTTELFWGDVGDIYRWTGLAVSSVGNSFNGVEDQSGTTPATSWSFVEFGAWVIATNGVDAPQIYKGTSFTALGGTPPADAQIVIKKGSYVLLMNTIANPNGYHWSDSDDPEDWVPVAANQAGDNIIRDFDGPIVAAVPLGDRIAMYGEEKMALLAFIGAPFIFGHAIALENRVGAVSKHSVVSVGDLNYGLSSQGFFATDGVTVQEIDLGHHRETFKAEFNVSQQTKVNAYHNAKSNEVIWYYPSNGSQEPNKGAAYNYVTRNWTFHNFGRTATIQQAVFDNPYAATDNGIIYKHNQGTDDDGEPMVAFVQTHPLSFSLDDETLEDFFKYIDAIKLGMQDFVSAGIKIRIGTQARLDDDIFYIDTIQLEDPSTPIYPKVSTRWVTIRIESSELGDTWELQSLTVHGKKVGGSQ